MKDRLRQIRSAVGEAASGAVRRVRRVGVDDDDEDAELLEPLEVPEDPELTALDEVDDEEEPELGLDHFIDLLRALEHVPPLPLTAPYATGLVPVLRRWGELEGPASFLADRRVLRVLGVLGDRYAITVGPAGITVRGLVRRRFTPWDRVQRLTFVDRYSMVRDHVLEGAIDDMVGRAVPVPVPGLRWLIRKLVLAIEGRLPEDQRAMLEGIGGSALQHIQRRGFDIELSGVMALVSFLSEPLTTVAASEARVRNIAVEGFSSTGPEPTAPAV